MRARRHRRMTGMRWACATAAPWALAAGLLVSFTAAAGNDPRAGYSAQTIGVAPLLNAGPLIPSSASLPGLDLIRAFDGAPGLAGDEGLAPRHAAKSEPAPAPVIDRARKGAPLAAPRPSLSRRGSDLFSGDPVARLGGDDRMMPASPLTPGPIHGPDPDAEPVLEPWQPQRTMTERATADRSPLAIAQGSTGVGRGGGVTPNQDGATPSVARAVALSSTTPAAAEAVPIEVVSIPTSLPPGLLPHAGLQGGLSAEPKADPTRPRYADLVDPDKMAREQHCLAQAVYFEARSEPEAGQAAVAQVVLNRVKSGLYPGSICGVVFQNRHRHLACQFTFTCEGKALRVNDGESWQRAVRIAKAVLDGETYLEDVGGATHYHADYVKPRWARKLKKKDVIGRHIFYQLRPGQT